VIDQLLYAYTVEGSQSEGRLVYRTKGPSLSTTSERASKTRMSSFPTKSRGTIAMIREAPIDRRNPSARGFSAALTFVRNSEGNKQ